MTFEFVIANFGIGVIFLMVRSDLAWKKIFLDAELTLVKEQTQHGLPEGLYEVKMYVLAHMMDFPTKYVFLYPQVRVKMIPVEWHVCRPLCNSFLVAITMKLVGRAHNMHLPGVSRATHSSNSPLTVLDFVTIRRTIPISRTVDSIVILPS